MKKVLYLLISILLFNMTSCSKSSDDDTDVPSTEKQIESIKSSLIGKWKAAALKDDDIGIWNYATLERSIETLTFNSDGTFHYFEGSTLSDKYDKEWTGTYKIKLGVDKFILYLSYIDNYNHQREDEHDCNFDKKDVKILYTRQKYEAVKSTIMTLWKKE